MKRGRSGKKKSMAMEFYILSRSQAAKGYLKYLKRFELIASFFVLGWSYDSHELQQLQESIVFHAILEFEYNSTTFELLDL